MVKYFSTNNIKLGFVNSRHNFVHWFIVVLIQSLSFLIAGYFSFHFFAIGFLLAGKTIKPYLPSDWFEAITYLSNQLPFFPLIKKLVFDQFRQWFQSAPVWWTMVVGLPLILLGISVFFSNFFTLYYSIFSPKYNRTHCPFCKQPMEIKT